MIKKTNELLLILSCQTGPWERSIYIRQYTTSSLSLFSCAKFQIDSCLRKNKHNQQPSWHRKSLLSFLFCFVITNRNSCRYGRIKGVHCSENKDLLTNILRKEWSFGGVVISDWQVSSVSIAACFSHVNLQVWDVWGWSTPQCWPGSWNARSSQMADVFPCAALSLRQEIDNVYHRRTCHHFIDFCAETSPKKQGNCLRWWYRTLAWYTWNKAIL